jgi:hypothetical protein
MAALLGDEQTVRHYCKTQSRHTKNGGSYSSIFGNNILKHPVVTSSRSTVSIMESAFRIT